MSVRTTIELTADGSHTLFVPELDEHYHSVNGAVQESNHVFIEAGLNQLTKSTIHIFEVGFGTGLNAYLTLQHNLSTSHKILYSTIEYYPLELSLVEKLNYSSDKALFLKLHKAQWNETERITPRFDLHKIQDSLIEFDLSKLEKGIDLIYFDAFAPDKQPEMWTQAIFDNIYSASNEGAILVTYCAKGVVRRMLQQSGFAVERIPGPPGKREMIRARKR